MVNDDELSGWWGLPTPLKNDGVRQWVFGWQPIYLLWKIIHSCSKPPTRICFTKLKSSVRDSCSNPIPHHIPMSPIRGGILEAMGSKNGKRWGPPGDVCWFINSMNPIVVISVTSPGSSKFRKWEDVRSASTWTQTRIPRYFFSQKTALVHSCSLQQRTRQMKHEFNYIYILN